MIEGVVSLRAEISEAELSTEQALREVLELFAATERHPLDLALCYKMQLARKTVNTNAAPCKPTHETYKRL